MYNCTSFLKKPLFFLKNIKMYSSYKAIPLSLVFFAEISWHFNNSLSSLLKIFSILFILGLLCIEFRVNKAYLYYFCFITFIFSIYFILSYNAVAAAEDLLRYYYLVLFCLYAYLIKSVYKKILDIFYLFMLLSTITQVILYLLFFISSKLYLGNTFDFGLILRASGYFTGFASYGYLCFVAYLLAVNSRRKKLSIIFLLNALLSFSYKLYAVILLYFVLSGSIKRKYKILFFIIIVLIVLLLVIFKLDSYFSFILVNKITDYSFSGHSARSESYRAMFNHMQSNLFGGIGIGEFGGPASVKYKSKYYDIINFNWYNTTELHTTDTYYPHLVIELGIFGAIAYLSQLLRWGCFAVRKKNATVFWILTALIIDSIFSFGLNSPIYLVSIIFIPGLLEEKSPTSGLK